MNMEQQPPSYTPKIVCISRTKYFSRIIGFEEYSQNYDLIYSTETEEENRVVVF